MCPKIEKTNWPLFFIHWSAAFPSVVYSSLWLNKTKGVKNDFDCKDVYKCSLLC